MKEERMNGLKNERDENTKWIKEKKIMYKRMKERMNERETEETKDKDNSSHRLMPTRTKVIS